MEFLSSLHVSRLFSYERLCKLLCVQQMLDHKILQIQTLQRMIQLAKSDTAWCRNEFSHGLIEGWVPRCGCVVDGAEALSMQLLLYN
uniref:Uncharacterized protein n=1 Tax=Arundo donax TaxID=35708 RepID=A0A0A9GSM9_ARUDO